MTYDAFDRAIIEIYHSPRTAPRAAYPEHLHPVLSSKDCDTARDVIRQWPGYQPSALHELAGLATNLGIASLFYKDESSRFGLGSFKALGGAYAVLCVLQREIAELTGEAALAPDIRAGRYADVVRDDTVVTAWQPRALGGLGRKAIRLPMRHLLACRSQSGSGQGG